MVQTRRMSASEEILSQLPIDSLAAQLGISPDQARAAAAQALPTLLHGMAANAQDDGGAASLAEAVGQHAPLDGVSLDDVDVADGEKIVGHVFGPATDDVVNHLAGTEQLAGLDSATTRKLLALLAPIVMSYLVSKVGGGIAGTILSQVLQSALGGKGGSSGGSTSAGGNILGDILGELLGRGRR